MITSVESREYVVEGEERYLIRRARGRKRRTSASSFPACTEGETHEDDSEVREGVEDQSDLRRKGKREISGRPSFLFAPPQSRLKLFGLDEEGGGERTVPAMFRPIETS